MALYRTLFDRALVRVDPERSHKWGFGAIRGMSPALRAFDHLSSPAAPPVTAMGLRFPHVLGLAAGFDKNALGIDVLAALGFGHVEIGTVTARPQPGNPTPRLFRLPEDRAVINRMGFNNDGSVAVAVRLHQRAERFRRRASSNRPILGINIGKTKVVPEDDQAAVVEDYTMSARLLAPFADYLAVNVSSPNTPGLRTLQSVERLGPLLQAVRVTANRAAGRRVPLAVKIAPDLDDQDVLAVADLALEIGLDAIIATNTTISRTGLHTPPARIEAIGAGGLSGAPVRQRANEVMGLLRERVGPDMALIGVGGITSAADAHDRLVAGATLLQAYSAFIYEGPAWPRRVLADLATSTRPSGA